MGLGAGAATIGILGAAGRSAKVPAPTDSASGPEVARGDRIAGIPVEGDNDTITANVFHLLGASWATTVDLPDGTSVVAGVDGDILEVRDSGAGRIIRAKVDGLGCVSVSSASEVPIIEGVFRALASQFMGAGVGYEPSVTVQAAPVPATLAR